MKRMTEAEAIEYIKTHASLLDYHCKECFAVRGDNYIPKRRFRRSWNRPDGVKTTRLPGVSAVFVAENDMLGEYVKIEKLPSVSEYGRYRFLLQGERVEWGNDDWAGEVVLANHKIIAIITD